VAVVCRSDAGRRRAEGSVSNAVMRHSHRTTTHRQNSVRGEEVAYGKDAESTAERTARTNALTNVERGRWRGKKKPNGNSIAGLSGRATSPSPPASSNVNGSTMPSPRPRAANRHVPKAEDISRSI
jgi:hypothetical protein